MCIRDRYGRVQLLEKMPNRFYCRARWHEGPLNSETLVFDLDFVHRDGRVLGGIREFTVKRAPREALLRGLGGDSTRLLYTVGWHEGAAPGNAAEAGDEAAKIASGTWLIAGDDALAGAVPHAASSDPPIRTPGSRRSPPPPNAAPRSAGSSGAVQVTPVPGRAGRRGESPTGPPPTSRSGWRPRSRPCSPPPRARWPAR